MAHLIFLIICLDRYCRDGKGWKSKDTIAAPRQMTDYNKVNKIEMVANVGTCKLGRLSWSPLGACKTSYISATRWLHQLFWQNLFSFSSEFLFSSSSRLRLLDTFRFTGLRVTPAWGWELFIEWKSSFFNIFLCGAPKWLGYSNNWVTQLLKYPITPLCTRGLSRLR